jgi:hypothetical protein
MESFDELFGTNDQLTFEKVVSLEMAFVIADFLSLHDIYRKLALLNKNFAKISVQL